MERMEIHCYMKLGLGQVFCFKIYCTPLILNTVNSVHESADPAQIKSYTGIF